jgi:hypothetical protein
VVAHRRQQGQRGDFARRDQLIDFEQLDLGLAGMFARPDIHRRIGDDGVGGAKVDTNDVLASQSLS